MDPITILITWAITNTFLSGVTNLAHHYVVPRPDRENTRKDLDIKQKDLELKQKAAQEQVIHQKAEFRHREEMLDKNRLIEIELRKLDFEHQSKLISVKSEAESAQKREAWDYETFPLRNFHPDAIVKMQQSLVVIAKDTSLPVIDKTSEEYRNRCRDTNNKLSAFLLDGWGWGQQSRSTIFLDGSIWREELGLAGQLAAGKLHSCLKDRAILFFEYQLIGNELNFNIAFWGGLSDKLSVDALPSQNYLTFATFSIDSLSPEQVKDRLVKLSALVTGAIADIHAMMKDLTLPLLPSRIRNLVGDTQDEVISQAINQVITSYVIPLITLRDTFPESAKRIEQEIFRHIKDLPDQTFVKNYRKSLLVLDEKIKEAARKNLTASTENFNRPSAGKELDSFINELLKKK